MGWEMSFITITVLRFGYQVFNLANCVFNLVNCVTTLPTEVDELQYIVRLCRFIPYNSSHARNSNGLMHAPAHAGAPPCRNTPFLVASHGCYQFTMKKGSFARAHIEVGVGGSCIIKQEWLICKKFLGLLFVQMVMLLRENFGPCNVKIFGQKC